MRVRIPPGLRSTTITVEAPEGRTGAGDPVRSAAATMPARVRPSRAAIRRPGGEQVTAAAVVYVDAADYTWGTLNPGARVTIPDDGTYRADKVDHLRNPDGTLAYVAATLGP